MSIVIRPSREEDAEHIVAFQIAMAWETERMKLDPPTVRLGVAAVFDDPGKGQYWVAEHEGRVIGSLLVLPEWSDWRNGQVLWIHSVYVEPEHRRRGAFRAMYARLRAEVDASPGLRGLRLYVEKNNQAAQAVYRSLGMGDDHYAMFEWMKS